MNLIVWILFALLLVFGGVVFFGAPFVPTRKKELRMAFLNIYPLGKNDFMVDLGAGDGLVLQMAAEFEARGLGVELNPLLVLAAKWRLRKCPGMKIKQGNLFKAEFPKQTTVVYVFGESRDIVRIAEKVQAEAERLEKKLFLISNAFKVPGKKAVKRYRSFYLYEFNGVK